MTTPDAASPVREGELLASKYRVERVLGQGGMGLVVLATHVELEQEVAIKFLLPEAVRDAEIVERFLREGRASVKLRGQHVVKTIDVGRLEDGAPYLVMEFLRGQNLRDAMSHHPHGMPLETMCSYLLQICEGVAEAHALGIVHRDLKPENLFVTHGVDGWPQLKVLDFGISKVANEMIGGAMTRTNTLFGSPMYMSPEQMRSAKHVDPRADVWSLAVIAYELACGHPPYDGDSFYDLALKVAQDTPQPLLERRPDLPQPLVDGIMRGLEKEVGKRLQSVADLAGYLEPYAGPRSKGTTARLRDVLRASGAAFSRLATDEPSSPNNVQSAWGATERHEARPRRRWVVPYVLALVAAVGVAIFATQRKAAPEPAMASLPASAFAAVVPVPSLVTPVLPAVLAAPAPSADWSAVDAGALVTTAGAGAHSGKRPPVGAASATPASAPAPSAAPVPPPPPAAPAPAPAPAPGDGWVEHR